MQCQLGVLSSYKKSSLIMKLDLATEKILHQLEQEGAIADAKDGDKKLKLLIPSP